MKNTKQLISTVLVILLSISLLTSSTIISNEQNIKTSQSSWGNWKQTDCLLGLDFRVKRAEYNSYAKKYKWIIEFRNRYKQNIHFSCKAVKPSQRAEIRRTGKTTDRKHVGANGGLGKVWFLVNAPSEIYIHVNKIRISEKDWGTDYYNCDK